MSMLCVKDLSFSYEEGQPTLQGLSFEAGEDELLCIAGPSGAGKTTLIKLLTGQLEPDGGSIHLGQQELLELPPNKRGISCIFQERFLYPHMTVYENLLMGLKSQRLSFLEKDRRVKDLLKIFGLTKFINLKPRHLSQGQCQQAAIAKCMASNDRLYLLDEPLSHVDAPGKEVLLKLLRQFQKEKRAPFICVCHDDQLLPRLADRILLLEDGKLLQAGTYEQLVRDPKTPNVLEYLGANGKTMEESIAAAAVNNKKEEM